MCPLQETASESNRGYGLLATFHVVRAATNAGKNVCYVVVWLILLFGLFGCLCFALWVGALFVFCCLGGGGGPAQTAKTNTHLPLPSVFFFSLGGLACSIFVADLGRGRVFFCCLGGGRGCFVFFFFFLRFGQGRVFFAVWAGAVFLFFCCLGAGREFTHLPVCLARL